ncbi:hypothetical protein KJ885_01900 [Patescibacteria group bacterium]|nr:hypothetical protein [Patescibacteria group bacterium]
MEHLKYEIQKVLVFYDIFNFPLTPIEVYKNLEIPSDIHTVYNCLHELKIENKINQKNGYYFFPHNEFYAERRSARFLVSFKKLKRARRVARILWRFPFIKFIGVCNSLGYLNASDESDIDFFIITKRGCLWTTRFLCASFLRLFNLRPTRTTLKNKICLSFILSENDLDISSISLQGGDPYLYRWMLWLIPLYDDGVYKKFINKNLWIKNHLPNYIEQGSSREKPFPLFRHEKIKFSKLWAGRFKYVLANVPISHIIALKWGAAFFKRFWEVVLGGRCERGLKYLQLGVMPKGLKEAVLRTDNSVVMNDSMLKFHLIDRRAEYRDKFYQRIKLINSKFT